MRADGGAQIRLTAPSGHSDDAPAWSPDGTRIAFQRCCFPIPGSVPDGMQVFTMNADGSVQANISGTVGTTSDFQPDWSPDGTQIVFGRCVCLTTADELYVMLPDGSSQARLSPGTNAIEPGWSPDGTRIAFRGAGTPSVFTMTTAGTGITKVPDGFDPSWQPT